MKIKIILFIFLITSCSVLKKKNPVQVNPLLKKEKKRYSLKDKAGNFIVYLEKGLKKKKLFISKKEVLPFDDDRSKILEQSIAISRIGVVKKKLKIMRPEKSQYVVWFDGKKYSSLMKLNTQSSKLEVTLNSPEEQWRGVKRFDLPDRNSVYCYFIQVLECASQTGFVGKAVTKGNGVMNFYVIWEGYPYMQEQYLNIPNQAISKAKLRYDGKNKNGEFRFSLHFGNQVIFYLLNDKMNFSKQLWISQGYSMIANDL